MNFSSFISLLICLYGCFNFAQTVEPSMGVEKNILQLEFESLYVIDQNGVEKVNSWSIPSVLIRYGFNNFVELQVNVPYLKEYVYEDDNIMSSRTFLDNVQAGVSVNLWEENGLLPQAAVMGRALIPAYDTKNGQIGTLLALNLSNTLTEQLSLNYNLGWVADIEGNSAYYVANLSWNISTVVHSFVEFFGSSYNKIQMNHNINTGIGFNFGKSFCLDLSIAQGLNQEMMFFGGVLTYQLAI